MIILDFILFVISCFIINYPFLNVTWNVTYELNLRCSREGIRPWGSPYRPNQRCFCRSGAGGRGGGVPPEAEGALEGGGPPAGRPAGLEIKK